MSVCVTLNHSDGAGEFLLSPQTSIIKIDIETNQPATNPNQNTLKQKPQIKSKNPGRAGAKSPETCLKLPFFSPLPVQPAVHTKLKYLRTNELENLDLKLHSTSPTEDGASRIGKYGPNLLDTCVERDLSN